MVVAVLFAVGGKGHKHPKDNLDKLHNHQLHNLHSSGTPLVAVAVEEPHCHSCHSNCLAALDLDLDLDLALDLDLDLAAAAVVVAVVVVCVPLLVVVVVLLVLPVCLAGLAIWSNLKKIEKVNNCY